MQNFVFAIKKDSFENESDYSQNKKQENDSVSVNTCAFPRFFDSNIKRDEFKECNKRCRQYQSVLLNEKK